ncbi:MAG: response regulator [Calditrichaceae bacterium]|jgi:DNA-binding NtrC family response regulator
MSEAENRKTILVIDDEEMIRDIAQDMLNHLGYNIVSAADGESAVEVFKEKNQSIDLIIVDLIMPRMNGMICLQKLKEINKAVPVIVASGISEVSKKRLVMDLGAHGYLEKPYSIKSLKEICSSVLESVNS